MNNNTYINIEARHLNVNSLKSACACSRWLAGPKPEPRLPAGNQARDAKFPRQQLADAGMRRTTLASARTTAWRCWCVTASVPPPTYSPPPGFADVQQRCWPRRSPARGVIGFYVPNGQSRSTPTSTAYKLECAVRPPRFSQANSHGIRRLQWRRFQHRARGSRRARPELCVTGVVLGSRAPRLRRLARACLKTASGCSSSRRRRSLVGLPAARLPKNRGLRIDHILLSAPLAAKCTAAGSIATRARREASDRAGDCELAP